MDILDRVTTSSNICKVQLSFSGVANASIIEGWQPFYNSTFTDANFAKTYASLSSIDFEEESATSPAGVSYNQKVMFRFPKNDKNRANRIALMQKIKFVKLVFSNGLHLVIGRNDYNQNARPQVKIRTNKKLCEVSVECQSIFPSGFTPGLVFGLPTLIPFEI